MKESDPAKLLEKGCLAFIDECADPAIQQIVMLDGPSLLGWEAWREREDSGRAPDGVRGAHRARR